MYVQYLFDLETSCVSAAFAGVQTGQVCPDERVEDMDVNQNCLQTHMSQYRIHV